MTDLNAHVLDTYDDFSVPWGEKIHGTWDFVRKHDCFFGIFIWTGFDYRGGVCVAEDR